MYRGRRTDRRCGVVSRPPNRPSRVTTSCSGTGGGPGKPCGRRIAVGLPRFSVATIGGAIKATVRPSASSAAPSRPQTAWLRQAGSLPWSWTLQIELRRSKRTRPTEPQAARLTPTSIEGSMTSVLVVPFALPTHRPARRSAAAGDAVDRRSAVRPSGPIGDQVVGGAPLTSPQEIASRQSCPSSFSGADHRRRATPHPPLAPQR